jgi:hypothetical protein
MYSEREQIIVVCLVEGVMGGRKDKENVRE